MFLHQATIALHCRSVKELLEHNDSVSLTKWYAFFMIHPFDDPWLRSSIMTSDLVNQTAGKNIRTYEYYMPVKKEVKKQSVDDMRFILDTNSKKV